MKQLPFSLNVCNIHGIIYKTELIPLTHCQNIVCHLLCSTLDCGCGVGRFKSPVKKWGLSDSAACEAGETEQTAEDRITQHKEPGLLLGKLQ